MPPFRAWFVLVTLGRFSYGNVQKSEARHREASGGKTHNYQEKLQQQHRKTQHMHT